MLSSPRALMWHAPIFCKGVDKGGLGGAGGGGKAPPPPPVFLIALLVCLCSIAVGGCNEGWNMYVHTLHSHTSSKKLSTPLYI